MNKVALVTGGSRGIGLGIARCLAADKCDLAIVDIRNEAEVQEALNELRGRGVDVLYIQADVSSRDDRLRMLTEIKNHFGRLNVLVNNAGIGVLKRGDILEATEESYDRVMDINLKAPYFLTQAVADWMIKQQQESTNFEGCIVNISSVSATVASITRGEYCLSKAGVSMATKLWAVRLGELDIPVYEIRPGIIMTDMTAPVKGVYDKLIAEGLTIQRRWGLPEDVGRAVAMLVRGDLPYTTGQALIIDGGMTLQRL